MLASFFARSLTLVPRSLLLNRTETLATQARRISKPENQFLCAQKSTSSRHYKTFLVKMNFLASPFNLSIRPALGVTREEILDDGEGEGYRDSIETESETVRQFLSFWLLSSPLPPETPNTQATALSSSEKGYHGESSHLSWKSNETIAARLPADMSRPTSGWV